MALHRGKDMKGPYYCNGATGKRYHYTPRSKISRDHAKAKAMKHGK